MPACRDVPDCSLFQRKGLQSTMRNAYQFTQCDDPAHFSKGAYMHDQHRRFDLWHQPQVVIHVQPAGPPAPPGVHHSHACIAMSHTQGTDVVSNDALWSKRCMGINTCFNKPAKRGRTEALP